MIEEARQHRVRARRLLEMVEKRWEQELPEIVVHTAYYAMYHAAIALFAKRDLPKPKTHSGLSARFSEHFRDTAPDGRDQVRRLGRALERRLIADYDAVDTLGTDDARIARDEAMLFVAFCEKLMGSE
ncbi:HEPN domain-containing protein [Reyranella sp.]|uniref:HEPN domain-containing protein n=1 Tax=Reyranella sp. TaxID=1929291 RepID=UPI003D102FB6